MKKWMIGVALLAIVLGVPAMTRAHEGHAHKVMGTVESIAGNHVTVKTTEGKIVKVTLDAKTRITQGKTKMLATALKVGDRIVAEGAEEKATIVATSVKVGELPPAAAKK